MAVFEKKDLDSSNFTVCRTLLGKQNTEISEAKSVISRAISAENGTKYPDADMKSTYYTIQSMFSTMYTDNVNNQISLGKTSTYVNQDDKNYATNIEEIYNSLDAVLQAIKTMTDSMGSNYDTKSVSVEDIANLLPPDRLAAFKSGNPWVSPDMKYLYWNGEAYEIVTSAHYQSEPDPNGLQYSGPCFVPGPTLVHTKVFDGDYFDWVAAVNALNDVSVDDMAVAAGSEMGIVGDGGALGTFFDLTSTVEKMVSAGRKDLSVTAEFYDVGGQKQVVLGVDFSDYQKLIDAYAGSSKSYIDSSASMWSVRISEATKDRYEELTGNKANNWKQYDVVVCMDELHLQDDHHMTITFGDNGEMIGHTPIYDGDKIQIQERTLILGIPGDVVYEQSLSSISTVDPRIAQVLLDGMSGGFND